MLLPPLLLLLTAPLRLLLPLVSVHALLLRLLAAGITDKHPVSRERWQWFLLIQERGLYFMMGLT